MPSISDPLLDALADELGRVAAGIWRDVAQERELRAAEHRAAMAEWSQRIASVIDIERRLTERLASLKDGEPGPQGERGAAGDIGPAGELGPAGADAPPPTQEQIEAAVATYIAANPPPAGRDGKDGAAGVDGQDGGPGTDGHDGKDGADGERGPEGPAGKLPIAEEWRDDVYVEGAAVVHEGSTYQALKATGKSPPHADWRCIAAAGRDGADGRSFTFRGTYEPNLFVKSLPPYAALDVVALDGGAFVALHDNPGPCPGEGWQLMMMRGKPGRPGDKGDAGKGIKGDPGPSVLGGTIDRTGMLTLKNADGTTANIDLAPALSQLN